MPIVVTVLTAITAVSLVLLCLFGDYPWEWLVMNPFTGALTGYVAMALRHWIQETYPALRSAPKVHEYGRKQR